jgi:predicted ester cyclase
MSTQENVTSANRIVTEMFSQGKLSVGDEVFAPGYIEHANVPPGLPPGLPGLKLFISALRAAFPDFRYTVEDVIAEGDKVAQRVKAHGTQNGEFVGIPATHRQVSWEEIHISDWADGKLVEHWVVQDQLSLLQQLGAMPVPQA